MRYNPSANLYNTPCSIVALDTAYRDIYNEFIAIDEIVRTRPDGYLALSKMQVYIKLLFKVKKSIQYTKKNRFKLKEFLQNNDKKCIICLLGHYIYVDGKNYYSFFQNLEDEVVKIWYVEGIKQWVIMNFIKKQ